MVEDVKDGLGDSENQSDLARRSDSLQSGTAIGKKAVGERKGVRRGEMGGVSGGVGECRLGILQEEE